MAGEREALVKAIREMPSQIKKPIHENKVGRWLRDVDAVIRLLPKDDQVSDEDKKDAQIMLASIMRGIIEECAESPALKAWAAESDLQSWKDIKDALQAEFIKDDAGRFLAAWRNLVTMNRKRHTRVQDHIMQWRSAYTNAFPDVGMPDPTSGNKAEEALFLATRQMLIETLNNRTLEEAVLIGVTDGRCNTWAEFSSFITSKAEALGVGKFEGEYGAKHVDGKDVRSGQQRQGQTSSPSKGRFMSKGKNPRQPSEEKRERYRREAKDGCFKCGKKGHLRKDCPERDGAAGSPGNGGPAGGH